MYKVLTIDGKEYKLEYTVEAALYKDGVDRLIMFMANTLGNTGLDEETEGLSDTAKIDVMKLIVGNIRSELTGLSQTALEMFYMGLIEYHGADGDKSVLTMRDAKQLAKEMFRGNAEPAISDFAELLSICFEQMGNDGFFKTIGLEKLMNAPKPNRAARRKASKN